MYIKIKYGKLWWQSILMFKWIVEIVIQDESLHYITTWNHLNNSTMNEWCESTIDLKSKTTSIVFFLKAVECELKQNGVVKIPDWRIKICLHFSSLNLFEFAMVFRDNCLRLILIVEQAF